LLAPIIRLAAQGWIDALRALHPGERIYTFWDDVRNAFARDAGLRIDHLLLSPSLASRLMRAEVDSGVRGGRKPAITPRPGLSLPIRRRPTKPARLPRPQRTGNDRR
jgi:exodeoxyribonuclease III